MTLLLDTHTFLWFCQGDASLSSAAKALIEDPNNRKLLSVVSCWEIAIKAGLKKLTLGEPSATYIPAALNRTGFELLPITLEHATSVESLPPHHKDPFDRLLVAQAGLEGTPLVSADGAFDAYAINRLW
jgi:PIN domain nuclease of toxin-antitoxin system